MAIEGPLRELALVDVLQLLHLSRKTGALSVRGKQSPRPALLLFEGGAVIGARAPGDANRLGRLLVMARAATPAQVSAALAAQRLEPERRLGDLLVETQGVSADEVRRQLRFQVEETFFQLVRWTDGYSHFEETAPPDPGPIKIRLSAESLLLEALRRLDEWSELASGAPDTTLVPRLVDGHSNGGGALRLAPQEWEVLAVVDGKASLRKMAQELGRAEFDVAKAVFALASAGVVELGARGAESRREPQPAGVEGRLAEIESDLDAGRAEAAEAALAELDGRHPERGDIELLRGRLAAMQGRWASAAEALELAVQRDPLLADAYYHLGVASIRVGALERAEEVLSTCARLPGARAEHRERAAGAVPLLTQLSRLLKEAE